MTQASRSARIAALIGFWALSPLCGQEPVSLPRGTGLTLKQLFRLAVPDYDTKWARGKHAREHPADLDESRFTVELAGARISDLGLPQRRFLVLGINETIGYCNSCHYWIFGVIDLNSKTLLDSYRADGSCGHSALRLFRLFRSDDRKTIEFRYGAGPAEHSESGQGRARWFRAKTLDSGQLFLRQVWEGVTDDWLRDPTVQACGKMWLRPGTDDYEYRLRRSFRLLRSDQFQPQLHEVLVPILLSQDKRFDRLRCWSSDMAGIFEMGTAQLWKWDPEKEALTMRSEETVSLLRRRVNATPFDLPERSIPWKSAEAVSADRGFSVNSPGGRFRVDLEGEGLRVYKGADAEPIRVIPIGRHVFADLLSLGWAQDESRFFALVGGLGEFRGLVSFSVTDHDDYWEAFPFDKTSEIGNGFVLTR